MAFLAPVLAKLVSCEDTALTGAPREGFCQAPGNWPHPRQRRYVLEIFVYFNHGGPNQPVSSGVFSNRCT